MKIFFTIAFTITSIMGFAQDTATEEIFFPASDLEYIPAEADYALIEDRLTCIQNEIPLNYHERVHAFVNYFAVKDREYTRRMIQRKELYFPLFEKYLAKYGLPDELKYLSIVESGLNPTAVSSARAVGLWQFMSYTGKHFGLNHDTFIDDRMDPEKSTEAACKYLKQLYSMFGDWEFAISAYNSGPGNVRKAIRKSGYKKTFWEVYPYLYRETRSYLPQFIAVMYVMNYAEEHNFDVQDIQYAMLSDTVVVKKYVHLETLASQLNICLEDIKGLNPSLKYDMVPETTSGYSLKLPLDVKPIIDQNRMALLDSAGKVGREELEKLAKNLPGSTYGREKLVYKVRNGDVLGRIADRYNVRVSDLQKWNNMRGTVIRVGQNLVIYSSSGAAPTASAEPVIKTASNGTKMYIVQPGDTLWDISRKLSGVSIEQIKELNSLSTNNISPGQELIIAK
jgi:membrane-bound lytic murein transglycosylase D